MNSFPEPKVTPSNVQKYLICNYSMSDRENQQIVIFLFYLFILEKLEPENIWRLFDDDMILFKYESNGAHFHLFRTFIVLSK